jgi:hypothetical protein
MRGKWACLAYYLAHPAKDRTYAGKSPMYREEGSKNSNQDGKDQTDLQDSPDGDANNSKELQAVCRM